MKMKTHVNFSFPFILDPLVTRNMKKMDSPHIEKYNKE